MAKRVARAAASAAAHSLLSHPLPVSFTPEEAETAALLAADAVCTSAQACAQSVLLPHNTKAVRAASLPGPGSKESQDEMPPLTRINVRPSCTQFCVELQRQGESEHIADSHTGSGQTSYQHFCVCVRGACQLVAENGDVLSAVVCACCEYLHIFKGSPPLPSRHA